MLQARRLRPSQVRTRFETAIRIWFLILTNASPSTGLADSISGAAKK